MPPHIFNGSLMSDQVLLSKSLSLSDDFASVATQKSVAKLNAEVSKLRAITLFTKAESEEKLLNQKEEMSLALHDLRVRVEKSRRKNQTTKGKIAAKEEYIGHVQRTNEEKDKELRMVEKEKFKWLQDINEAKTESENWKLKNEALESEISTLMDSLNSLLGEQERIVESSIALEKHLKEESYTRMNRLHSMLDAEIEFKKESSEIRNVSLYDKNLTDIMQEQKEVIRHMVKSLSNEASEKNKRASSPPRLLVLKFQ